MSMASFDEDSYEDHLAIILLDVLLKKDMLTSKNYTTIKNIICEKEDSIIDNCNNPTTITTRL